MQGRRPEKTSLLKNAEDKATHRHSRKHRRISRRKYGKRPLRKTPSAPKRTEGVFTNTASRSDRTRIRDKSLPGIVSKSANRNCTQRPNEPKHRRPPGRRKGEYRSVSAVRNFYPHRNRDFRSDDPEKETCRSQKIEATKIPSSTRQSIPTGSPPQIRPVIRGSVGSKRSIHRSLRKSSPRRPAYL